MLALSRSFAPRDAHAAEPGAELTISLLTMGPGDHPFYKFGHDAILVRDAQRHHDEVYNYGTFDYRSPSLVGDFLKGRLMYWLSVQPLAIVVAQYRSENRTIVAQELALTPMERRALADHLARDSLPANRSYRYDYFRDNCATRVRDVIDEAARGRLHAASMAPGSLTFRGHTERLTSDDPLIYLGLDVAMGDAIDRHITQWDEMFLPVKLEEGLRRVTVVRREGEAPLVAAETVLLNADRLPPRARPPRWGMRMGIAGAVLGGLVATLGRASRPSKTGQRSTVARAAFGTLLAAIGTAAGLLGAIFVFFWAGTDHYVAHHNENILQFPPLGLALAVVALALALRNKCARAVASVTAATAACSIAGLLLKTLPSFDQANGPIIALLLPVWLGAAVGARYCAKA